MSENKPKVDSTVMLRNVRLSFPDLFEAKQYEGKGDFSYGAAFLVEPGSANDKAIRAAIEKAAKAKWGEKTAAIMKTIEGQSQKYCYVDGDTKAYDGYAGKWALSTKRPQDAGRPKVIDKDLRELTVEEGRPYGGCYVNAKVQFWAQDNQWGKGIRCTLIAVQFVADGESFGGAPQATTEGFESVETDADDLV